ncbi:amidohydrolase [Sanguibacter sp. HDW7]|uniref:amidohydrolase n=1 Tax=Sanguibacter sp. HDW7 TaxID=2714931 RepID=UPI0014094226|nr:amidohydrolase [Sanguibacter sp. HDW7]QIK82923.1 amidohydrolase [Sanguibacter sp. HDW7]
MSSHAVPRLAELVDELADELVSFRRDVHAHPELARAEVRTTALVAERLRAEGLEPRMLAGTGLTCDIGTVGEGDTRPRIGLRADLDALPVPEATGLPFASTVPGVSHACGHDVHTAVVLGAGIALARLHREQPLPHPVRLVLQPAEEVQPGGALDLLQQGVTERLARIFTVHCEPKLDVGLVGTRIGPITSASDEITIRVEGFGGHTSRPHLTGDVVAALAQLATQLPVILGRRLDPRSGINLTWGTIRAGDAHNAIPTRGLLRGTLRSLDARAAELAGPVLVDAVAHVAAPFGVTAELTHIRGVPPVVNDEACTRALDRAVRATVGPHAAVLTEQSLGGEDFAWYLTKVPGALARLGTRTPGSRPGDLHQADFVPDEQAITLGARLLAAVALDVDR